MLLKNFKFFDSSTWVCYSCLAKRLGLNRSALSLTNHARPKVLGLANHARPKVFGYAKHT